MDLEAERRRLKEEFERDIAPILHHAPTPPALDMKILSKSQQLLFEEWKVEYTVETADTMPTPAGQTVSAYLLIPRKGERVPPYPGVVCFHQCAIDCTRGKEAVLGKAFNRPDQAYGYELAREGFVVLAPDSINCGERPILAIRQPGEDKRCFDVIGEQLGRPHWEKETYDALRAVDLLTSLDVVDSNRIGVVGHSMGAGDAYRSLLFDPRVKAGIMSGRMWQSWWGDGKAYRYLPLHAPHLHIALIGTLDKDLPPDLPQLVAAYDTRV